LISLVGHAANATDEINFLPEDQRVRFRNTDGSCVQCSIGMSGAWMNIEPAELLLWRSEYGKAIRGGSGPSDVRKYLDARNIQAYSVVGNTMPWVEWALKTGRSAAVLYGAYHFVTAVGISEDGQRIAICDNNSPARIQWMTTERFRKYHLAWSRKSTGWVVILKYTPPPERRVKYLEWWK